MRHKQSIRNQKGLRDRFYNGVHRDPCYGVINGFKHDLQYIFRTLACTPAENLNAQEHASVLRAANNYVVW